ncbi:MULE transposase domain [Fragilaria crotonensis]|nr:MULE transposase domain [Fragilaria crotonensis]
MYVASGVLSGTNEVYPIGFMISSGNEDGKTWTTMLKYLKACPIISEQGFGNERDNGEIQHPFLFVSNRDKGLKLALRNVFPRNKETSCAKHIEAKVCQKFGQQCARYVMAIAKRFSFSYSNHLIDQVRTIKPQAADYIENFGNDTLWRSTSWLDEQNPLPPHHGIVTSNTSECVNNMFAQARTVEWLEAVESIVDVMSTRISTCQTKHIDREPGEVVPCVAQILKRRWDAVASITVVELVHGREIQCCGAFDSTRLTKTLTCPACHTMQGNQTLFTL